MSLNRKRPKMKLTGTSTDRTTFLSSLPPDPLDLSGAPETSVETTTLVRLPVPSWDSGSWGPRVRHPPHRKREMRSPLLVLSIRERVKYVLGSSSTPVRGPSLHGRERGRKGCGRGGRSTPTTGRTVRSAPRKGGSEG